jgi:hypothetical protein
MALIRGKGELTMRPADNPFETRRINLVPYQPQGWSWEELLQRLRNLHYRAAVVGGFGSGKSRLLQELGSHLEKQGLRASMFRVGPGCSSCPEGLFMRMMVASRNSDVILLDEADRLPRHVWAFVRLLSMKAHGMIVTSHEPGLLPVLVECRTSVQLLEDILGELVGEERKTIQELSGQLFREHRGNIREVLRALYDVYAERTY